jgi:hypothetical protein
MKAGMEASYKAGIFFSSGSLALRTLLCATLQHEKGGWCLYLEVNGDAGPLPHFVTLNLFQGLFRLSYSGFAAR